MRWLILGLFVFAAVPKGPEEMVKSFLQAISAKDEPTLKTYIQGNFSQSRDAAEWLKRLRPLVNQGAPFKLVKMVDSDANRTRALIEDRNGHKLALILMTTNGKIAGLLLDDPDILTEAPPKDYSGWKDLATLVEAVRVDTSSPGMAVAVGRGGNALEVAVSGTRRVGSSEKAEPDDRWHIGSIAKSMTSTMIGRLIEMGKLKWDTTLKEALPGVSMKPEYEQVTLLQIMRHRGGLPQDMNFTYKQVQDIIGDETDPVKMRTRYAADILGREPLSRAGTKFAYSNAGYALLGHIAELTMQQPYEKLVRSLVFAPLGMTSAIAGRTGLPADGPSGHIKGDKGFEPYSMDGPLGVIICPAGDVSMSISDLARYGRAHLEGLRGRDGLLKAATVKKLHEAIPEDDGGPGYGCGWSVGALRGTALRHGHNGSNGTFRAELAIFPDSGLVVAAIVNRGGEAEPSPPLQAVLAIAHRYAPEK